jgi:hypothetical protein
MWRLMLAMCQGNQYGVVRDLVLIFEATKRQ